MPIVLISLEPFAWLHILVLPAALPQFEAVAALDPHVVMLGMMWRVRNPREVIRPWHGWLHLEAHFSVSTGGWNMFSWRSVENHTSLPVTPASIPSGRQRDFAKVNDDLVSIASPYTALVHAGRLGRRWLWRCHHLLWHWLRCCSGWVRRRIGRGYWLWWRRREQLRLRPSVARAIQPAHLEDVGGAARETKRPGGPGSAPSAHSVGTWTWLGVVRLALDAAHAGVFGVEPVTARGDGQADGGEVGVRSDDVVLRGSQGRGEGEDG